MLLTTGRITIGLADQGKGGRKGRHPACTAASDSRWKTNVRGRETPTPYPRPSNILFRRTDDKTAAEYNLVAGDTLHLVLALRGGQHTAC